MNLIEEQLKSSQFFGLERAASQIQIRSGFKELIKSSLVGEVYILSCNWSTDLIQLVCPKIKGKNIIANSLKFKDGKCSGFDRKRIILTPEDKFKEFKKIKGEKIVCGDSLPDLLPMIHADKGFAFLSHDSDFIEVCKLLRERFSRNIHIVSNFTDVLKLLK